MFENLMESVCRTGIFILCAQVLLHFRPKAVYEKYLKMLVSAMILVQLFAPVGSLLPGADIWDWEGSMAEFEKAMEERLAQTAQEANQLETVVEENQTGGVPSISVPPISQISIVIGGIEVQAVEGGRQDAADSDTSD